MSHKKSLSGFIGMVLMLVLFSCEYEKRDPFDPDSLPDEISYSEHVQPIFNAKCVECHPNLSPPDLRAENSYFDLTSGSYLNLEDPENSYFYKIVSTGSMSDYTNENDRAVILKWIEQGARDN